MLTNKRSTFLCVFLTLIDNDQQDSASIRSKSDQTMIAFSAPPMLLDAEHRFYEDFLEEFASNDPEMQRDEFVKNYVNFHNLKTPGSLPQLGLWHHTTKTQDTESILKPISSNPYRKFSLQCEEINQQSMSNLPTTYFPIATLPSLEQELLRQLDHVCQWARDQYGSRAVQAIIEHGDQYSKQTIFTLLVQESNELIKDKFGNYVFQRLFEKGTIIQQQKLFEIVRANLLSFSESCYGCRVVQKAIEYLRSDKLLQQQIVSILEPYSLYLIENLNGNHVMQKCFEIIELPILHNIIIKMLSNLQKLSLHAFGCRVIQKYLQRLDHLCRQLKDKMQGVSDTQQLNTLQQQLATFSNQQENIFEKLLTISIDLSQCQYGNYVMQHIVLHSRDYKSQIEKIFFDNFTMLSCNKYASNVVEKAIKLAAGEYREALAQWLLQSTDLFLLAKHQYGNYVIQSLLQMIATSSRNALKARLKENSQEISKSQYGRHVLLQLHKVK